MCGGGKSSTQTSSNSTTALPQFSQAYSDILNQAKGVASTAYNPATNKGVAGFTDPQNQAFGAVQSNLGAYQPYMAAAGASAAAGAAPVSTEGILANYNPFIQSQIDALQGDLAHQNAMTLQSTNANAAKIGALTGDRSQVAAQIAQNDNNRNAATAMSQLQSNAYNQAAEIAQGNQKAALAGANIYGALGGQAQQYGQNDVNSLWSSGLAQQSQQQNVLDANTANAQQEMAWPYQNLQWLSSLATSLGGAAGSNQNGSTTTPQGNIWSQLMGAGLGIVSGFADGGRVGHAEGGGVAPFGNIAWMPQSSMAPSGIVPRQQNVQGKENTAQQGGMGGLINSFNQAKSAFKGSQNIGTGISNIGSMLRTSTGPASFSGTGQSIDGFPTTVNPTGVAGWGTYFGNMFSGGGIVRGYADGGEVDDDEGLFGTPSLDGTPQSISPWDNDGAGITSYMPYATGIPPSSSDSVYASASEPIGTPPAQLVPSTPSNSSSGKIGALPIQPTGIVGTPRSAPEPTGLLGFDLSDETRRGLLGAGLGMMASRSPFFAQGIGEGGLEGLKAYSHAQDSARAAELKRAMIAERAEAIRTRSAIAAAALKQRTERAEAMRPYHEAQRKNFESLVDARAKRASTQDLITRMLSEPEGPADAIPSGDAEAPAEVRPQSFNSERAPRSGIQNVLDTGNPGDGVAKILAADGAQTSPTDVPAPSESAGQSDLLDTPFGRMTPQRAKRLGGAMLLDPQYAAAGKALVDQATSSSALGKTVATQNDKDELATTNQMATLNNIQRSYDAKYLNIPNRFKLWGNALASKFGDLNENDSKDLKAYTTFRQSAWSNLNRILKDLSGTAVTENEMQRQLLDQPNPGQGIFDGDSPQEFKQKLDNKIAWSKMAIARSRYLRKQGFSGKPWEAGIDIESMPDIIKERGAVLQQQYRGQHPDINPKVLQNYVTKQLKSEFGI